ncbi:MAG: Transglycosylase-associated protein [Candidatus Saccharibacteria bacterium]|nr:Transglycosylase-associated protein [Candidatus Saccharibacteria bacterium]
MTEIIAWIIIGALAGWIASIIMKTNAEMGAIANIIVGILGAFIGGFVVRMLTGADTTTGFNVATLLTSILGAVILLAIVRMFRRPRTTV